MRKVMYFTGTRADFGLMRGTLDLIQQDPLLQLGVVATGMHLSEKYGLTIREVDETGFDIVARVETDLEASTGASMARAIGQMVIEFTDVLEKQKPDVVLLLGDRGEMLAAAIAAVHLNIAVAHIHGGERSGTVDEMVRHAITKLAHVHFVATEESMKCVVAMGEQEWRVTVTGAPGLDEISRFVPKPKDELFGKYGLSTDEHVALMVFHPVVQEADEAASQAELVARTTLEDGWRVLALEPNSDAGGDGIRASLGAIDSKELTVLSHLPRPDFMSFLTHAELLVGNSSAGIIEAASFGIPVINIGSRQNLRERNANVIDLPAEREPLLDGLQWAKNTGRFAPDNVYGDGQAGMRICNALKTLQPGPELLNKVLAY